MIFTTGSHHPDDDAVERYSLGKLIGPELVALEEHLLICGWCQIRVTEADEFVVCQRLAARLAGGIRLVNRASRAATSTR
jgi:hypothetical protein